MVILAISAPLVLSSTLRILVDHNNVTILADNLLIVLFVQWMPSLWTAFSLSLSLFIGLAFHETREEYMCSKGNVRENAHEISAEHITFSSSAISHPSTSNLKSNMCPVKSFGISGLKANTFHLSQHLAASAERKIPNGFCKETNNLQELYGKPLLFPCNLRHRRITPFKDSFRHSYLYVGMPVGLHATYSPIISVDQPQGSRSKWPFREEWFNLKAEDHAIRGGAHMTMSQKMTEYLLSVVSLGVPAMILPSFVASMKMATNKSIGSRSHRVGPCISDSCSECQRPGR
jgi:hypothetical protein